MAPAQIATDEICSEDHCLSLPANLMSPEVVMTGVLVNNAVS
jgi:hypothetical protein